ncbi:MAG: MASE1 domain-containing protein [Magnetococcales bacterium]|nr:MASE1 domain-containing protein [Magnetococcales bacterium]
MSSSFSASRWIIRCLLVTSAYYLSGRLGLAIPSIGQHITLIWLPTGIAVAALLRWGNGLWPAVYLGALLTNLSIGSSLLLAAGIAVGNTLGPLLTANGLRRVDFHWEFDYKFDVIWLVLTAMAGMTISASGGTFLLWLNDILPASDLKSAWFTWWMGDCIGVLLAAPPLIALSPRTCQFTHEQRVEIALVSILLLSLNWFIFLAPNHLTLAYIPVLIVMWAALRFGIIGASVTVLADAVLSAWGTAIGHGPFSMNEKNNLLILWIYILTHTVVSLVITALRAESRRLEIDTQEAYLRLNKIASRVPGLVYQFRLHPDGSSCLPYVSEAIRHIYRMEPSDVHADATAVLQRTHPDDYAAVMDSILRSARELSPWQQAFRVRYPDGTERWLFGDSIPEREPDGSTLWHGFITDITSQKEAQSELLRAKEQAEAASRAKTDFLSAMSHEIRTPMNVILGMSDVVLGTELSQEQRHYMTMLKNAGDNLLQLINDILDLSKVEANKLQIVEEAVSVQKEAGEVVHMLQVLAHKKGVSLELRMDPRLPERILSDSLRFRQCLLNLVGNAIKFTEYGWVVVDIGQNDNQPPDLQCTISDSGIGIRPEHLEKIFELFSQSDAGISRRYGGTGLGLPLTKQLLSRMGGTIRVESEFGQGSRFHFTLPLRAAVDGTQQPMESPPPAHTIEQETPPLKILLVEDVEENRALIEIYLSNTPYSLAMACNGSEGVQRVQNEVFDLVLMDIEMPVLNGMQATALIRQWEQQTQHKPVTIIALSAHTMAGDAERCRANGFDDYLGKPIKKQTLLAALARYTAGRATEDRNRVNDEA